MNSLRALSVCKIISAIGIALALASPVQAAVLSASHEGWINSESGANSSGFNGGINNHFAGWENGEINNWFNFLLPSSSFSSATLYIWNDSNNQAPALDPSAFYTIHAASEFTFAGLEFGSGLGSVTLASANTGIGHYVGISLNAAGLTALNANAGGQFNFGGSITTSYANPENTFDEIAAFGWTGGVPLAYLEYNSNSVPEPASLALLGLGLAGLGFTRRRKA